MHTLTPPNNLPPLGTPPYMKKVFKVKLSIMPSKNLWGKIDFFWTNNPNGK